MGLLVSVGVLFISVSVVSVVAVQLLWPRPHLIVLAMSSAFTYSLAAVLSAAVWFAIPPLRETFGWVLFVSTTVQEASRLALWLVFAKLRTMGDGVQAFLRPGMRNEMLSGLAVGLGYAATSVLVNYYAPIADSYMRDTAVYIPACPEINFFVAGAALSLAFSVMHLVLGLLVWPWYEARRPYAVGAVYVIHLATVMVGLGNTADGGCGPTIGVVWAVAAGLVAVAAVSTVRRLSSEAAAGGEGKDA